jgi:hypothetical protein
MGKRLGNDQSAILQAETGRGSSFGTQSYNERWKQLSTLRLGVALACFGNFNRELGYEPPPVPIHGRLAGRAVSPLLTSLYAASRLWQRMRDFRNSTPPADQRMRRNHT